METAKNVFVQSELFSSLPHKKTPKEILAQLERIQRRYKRYNVLYTYQIREILDMFKKYDYNSERGENTGENINYEKIQEISQNKLYRNLMLLSDFNSVKGTEWGAIAYLYESLQRSAGGKKISLIHPHSFSKIQKNVDLLKQVEFAGEELNLYLMQTAPWVKNPYLNYTRKRNKNHMDRLKNTLEMSDIQVRKFIHETSDFFYCPIEKYERKVVYLQSLGCEKTAITSIISWFPHCLNCSEEKLGKTLKKIEEIVGSIPTKILAQYPQLFYFNSSTEFFRRMVTGLAKWHKRYQSIIKRIQERFSYRGQGEWLYFQALSEEEYLKGLQTEEYKRNFTFNPEESKKSFTTYKNYIFTECWKYISSEEQKLIIGVYQKNEKGEVLSKREKLIWEYLREKIEKKDSTCYDGLVKIFTYKKGTISELRKETNEELPL